MNISYNSNANKWGTTIVSETSALHALDNKHC